MSPEKLVMMANQIAAFFASQKRGDAVAATADHLLKFWEPRMRADMLKHLDAGGTGLSPVARDAAMQLRPAAAPAR